MDKTTRRQFLKRSMAAAVVWSFGMGGVRLASSDFVQADAPSPLPTRPLGRTGWEVSLFSLGGQGIIEQPGNDAAAQVLINQALDLGVNYIDTAPSYGSGTSERYIGEVMSHRRSEVFLASKTHDRSYDGTMRLIEQSLARLQTDHLDLYQLHNVRTDTDLDRIFAPQGALKALTELQEQGVVDFLGITGHRDPDVLMRGLGRFDFDCILMALNAADIHYQPFQTRLLQMATDRDMGITAMKIPAHGRMLRPDGVSTMAQALGYVYTFPISNAVIGLQTTDELEENVEITKAFQPLSAEQMAELEELTAHYVEDASFFKFRW